MHARAVIQILLFFLVLSGLAAGELSFLVLGDWGTGNQSQKAVARGMGHVAERMKSRFVVTTGDNFYEEGVSSVQDPKWQEYFGMYIYLPLFFAFLKLVLLLSQWTCTLHLRCKCAGTLSLAITITEARYLHFARADSVC